MLSRFSVAVTTYLKHTTFICYFIGFIMTFLATEENHVWGLSSDTWRTTIKHKIGTLHKWFKKFFNDFICVKTTHDLWLITYRIHVTIFNGTCCWHEIRFNCQIFCSLDILRQSIISRRFCLMFSSYFLIVIFSSLPLSFSTVICFCFQMLHVF